MLQFMSSLFPGEFINVFSFIVFDEIASEQLVDVVLQGWIALEVPAMNGQKPDRGPIFGGVRLLLVLIDLIVLLDGIILFRFLVLEISLVIHILFTYACLLAWVLLVRH